MDTADLHTINEIKHRATDIRYRLETAARGCITITGICWEALGADLNLTDPQKLLLDNIRFELSQLEEHALHLSSAVNHAFDAANKFDKEVNQ